MPLLPPPPLVAPRPRPQTPPPSFDREDGQPPMLPALVTSGAITAALQEHAARHIAAEGAGDAAGRDEQIALAAGPGSSTAQSPRHLHGQASPPHSRAHNIPPAAEENQRI
jgi:hypothetical protein